MTPKPDPVVSPSDTPWDETSLDPITPEQAHEVAANWRNTGQLSNALDAMADVAAALLAVGERDKAEIDGLQAEVQRLADRAVCSGCGSDVGESGVCPYPDCYDGEMIPASDLPVALRNRCDSIQEDRAEWRSDWEGLRAEAKELERERERDRQRIAQLTDALEEICRPQYEIRRDRVDIARAALKAIGADPAAVLADKEDADGR